MTVALAYLEMMMPWENLERLFIVFWFGCIGKLFNSWKFSYYGEYFGLVTLIFDVNLKNKNMASIDFSSNEE